MHTIGPYRFSAHDAERTIATLPIVWALLAEGRDDSVLAPLLPDLDGPIDEVLPRAWAALRAAGPALRAAGQLPARAEGVVAGLHLGDGGVPKRSVAQVEVGFGGVVGDHQKTRVHHGRPWQALCLWSSEVIAALAADGHPIAPGCAGENITISGLPWADIRAGVQLRIGEVLCEVSAPALPCKQNIGWFVDGDVMVMHHERGPVSRMYATVLEPGSIRTGDQATLEP